MTLRKKALLIIAVTLVCLVPITYVTSRLILMNGLAEIEKHDTHQSVERALGALSQRLSNLEATTTDWAAWDDTYAFIEDANDEYIQSNLIDETFINLGLNLILFINSSSQIVFEKTFDLQSEEGMPISPSLQEHLSDNGFLTSYPDTESSTSGIILVDEGPMLIASRPILTSEFKGPARGTLIFGRYLDSTEINHLTEITSFPLTMRRIDNTMYADFQEALQPLLENTPVFVQPLNTQYMGGYALIKDIHGKPILIMRVDIPRDVYKLGEVTIAYLALTILGIGLVAGVIVILIIEKQVLSRFTRLISGVNHIATSGDISARISMKGSDELSLVAGTIDGMLGALEESEGELRQRESRYRLLAENVTDVIFTMDTTLKFTYVSPSVTQLTGYSAEEAVTNTLAEILTPASNDTAMQAFAEELAKEKMEQEDLSRSRTLALEVKRKDGSTVWCELIMSALRDPGGQVVRILGVARDITERRRANEELQELYQHEKELRQQVEEEMGKRAEFTRALVHELKTPITPVLAASELLLEETKDERTRRLVESIDRSASNLNRRIDELLDLAKGEINALQIEPESIDPRQLLEEIGYEMLPVALRNKQSLTLELPPSLSMVWADKERLRQVVVNIINNAFKFTPAEGSITLKAREDGANLIVEVQDTGPGISKEGQERLFNPYHRLPEDRERLSGLGLGLALSKTLVELHGGKIWVKSKKGEGSTFGFSVPLEATAQKKKGTELREKQ